MFWELATSELCHCYYYFWCVVPAYIIFFIRLSCLRAAQSPVFFAYTPFFLFLFVVVVASFASIHVIPAIHIYSYSTQPHATIQTQTPTHIFCSPGRKRVRAWGAVTVEKGEVGGGQSVVWHRTKRGGDRSAFLPCCSASVSPAGVSSALGSAREGRERGGTRKGGREAIWMEQREALWLHPLMR